MKNLLLRLPQSLFILTFSIITLSFISCEEKLSDKCDDTKLTEKEVSFVFNAQVKYNDDVPYTGSINYMIWKNYCDNTESGVYEQEGVCNSTGYWNPAMIYRYKYANLEDRVTIFWYVENSSGVSTKIYSQTFKYEDVSVANEVNKTYNLTTPWSSTE